jgi:hypothetical protein
MLTIYPSENFKSKLDIRVEVKVCHTKEFSVEIYSEIKFLANPETMFSLANILNRKIGS